MKKSVNALSTRKMMIVGLLGSVSIVLGAIPGLGFIPVGPTRATIMHIPVIIGAIMEGPLVGGLIGLIFGLFSIFQAATNPTPVSFVFLNPIVSVLPRVLIGIVTYYAYRFSKNLGSKKSMGLLNIIWIFMLFYLFYGLYAEISDFTSIWSILINMLLIILTITIVVYANKKMKDKAVDIIISTALGTLTNTVGVLSTIYFIYGEQYVEKLGQSAEMARKIILGIGVANGIPEIIIGIIVVTNVVVALNRKK
ncbi:pantothenate ECF transporter [Clostridium sp. Cult1]|nr:ECF transporter S component [Clostridium sp. Cult1]MCF6462284.1 pantothenate ECF transporter [Clostridium sp. Cult1]